MEKLKTYSYIAIDTTGKHIKGTMDAPDKNAVIGHIYDLGLTPISVDEIAPWFSWEKIKEMEVGGVPLSEKVFFMKQLAVMINAGLPVTNVFDILSKQVKSKKLQQMFADVKEKVSSGIALSKAFADYPEIFDSITIALIKAGEESGHLDVIFKRLSQEYSERHKIASKLKSAMTYPVVVMIVVVLVVVAMMVFIVPQMTKSFISFGAELPLITKIVVAVSNSLIHYSLLYLIGLVLIFFSLRFAIHTDSGKKIFDALKLKMPVFGPLVMKMQVITFARVLQLLVASGVPILRALELTKQSLDNYWFKVETEDLITIVKQGGDMAARLLQSPYFPPIVGYMVNVGQKTGKMDELLKKLVGFYNVELRETIRGLTAAIQPIMIIVLGIVVGVIVVAIYMPLVSLAQNVG